MPPTSSHQALTSENRFARYTVDDHSAPIWIASLLSPVVALCILAVRLGFVKRGRYRWDDYSLIMAYVPSFGMWISLFISLQNGLGKSLRLLSTAEISRMQKTFHASHILLYFALSLSKSSALLLIWTTFRRAHRVPVVVICTMLLVIIWFLLSFFGLISICAYDRMLSNPNGLSNLYQNFLIVITGGDMLTELFILIIPLPAIWELKMKRSAKILDMSAFCSRILNIIASVMHLLASSKFIKHSQQSTEIVPTIVWQLVLLTCNLASATPSFKNFTEKFKTGGLYNQGDVLASNCTPMKSLSTNKSNRPAEQSCMNFEVQEASLDLGDSSGCRSDDNNENRCLSLGSTGSEQELVH